MDYEEKFKNAWQLYITKDNYKISKLNKIYYCSLDVMIGSKNTEKYKYYCGSEDQEIEPGVYSHNSNYYFSFSKAKLQHFVNKIERYKKIISEL